MKMNSIIVIIFAFTIFQSLEDFYFGDRHLVYFCQGREGKTIYFRKNSAFYGKSMKIGTELPYHNKSHLRYGPKNFGHFCTIYRPE